MTDLNFNKIMKLNFFVRLILLLFIGLCCTTSAERPSKPVVTSGTINTTELRIAWTGSADNFNVTTYFAVSSSEFRTDPIATSPFSVINLTPGQSYYFIVTAYNETVTEHSDASDTATTVPSKPGKPTVAAGATDSTTELKVTWTYTGVADDFTIRTQTTGTSSPPGPIRATGSPHTVPGLKPGEVYTFTVTANSGGKSGAASDSSARTRTVPSKPGKPTVAAGATDSTTKLEVTWTYTGVAGDFTIRTQTTGTSSPPGPIRATGSPHTVPGLIPGEVYTFKVTANSDGKSGAASDSSVPARTFPSKPGKPIVEAGTTDSTTELKVSWTYTDVADSFTITTQTTGSSSPPGSITVTDSLRSYTVTGLIPGEEYVFTITASSGGKSGAASDPSVPARTKAQGVTGISAANQTIGTIFVQWNPPGNTKVDKYQFSYSMIDMFSTPENTTTMNLTAPCYEITSLAAGTLYRIEVSVISSNKISDPVSADLATTPLKARNITAPTLTNTVVDISWLEPSSGGYHQFIIVAYNEHGLMEQNITVSNSSFSTQLSDLTPGTYFNITVQVEYFGVKSSLSDVRVSTKPDPVSMLNVLEKSHSTNPTVTWSAPLLGSADHYIITYKFRNGTLLWNDTVNRTTTSYDLVLVQGNGYLVFVTTIFAGFKGNSVSKSTTIYPDSVKSLTVEREAANPTNQLFLSWGKPSGNGHNIVANCTGNCVSPTHNFGFEDTNGTIPVKPGENYTITVFVISFQNLQSNETTGSITSQPSKPTVTVTPNIESIDLEWSIVGNVEYFEICYVGASSPNSMVTVPMSVRSYTIQKLWPATEYTIRVQAVVTDVNSVKLPSANYSSTQLTNSAAPPMPNNTRLASSSASTSSISFVLPKDTFNDKSGPILFYGVYLSSPNRRDLTEPDPSKNDSCDAFASGSVRECVALWADNAGNLITPSSRKRRSYDNPQWNDDITFTIGSGESTVSPWQTNYVNSPLTANTEYIVAICAKTSNPTFACTTWSAPIRTQVAATSTGLIVGVVLGVIAAIVLLFVLIFFYRKSQKKQSNRVVNTPAVSESAVYVNHVEIRNRETTTSAVKEQFKKLSQVGSNNTSKVAKIPANKQKNRDVNLLPYDSSRVVLPSIIGKSDSDYINASYIPGKSYNKEYIATQGVLRNTMDDFWRMIWEQKSSVIVLLTNLSEKGDIVCEQYWPESVDPVEIQTTMNLKLLSSKCNKDGFRMREFNLLRDGDSHVVQQFHFTAWTDEAKPSSEFLESFVKFVTAVRDEVKTSSPIVVQCCNGGGRSGVFITVDQLLQTINPSSSDDIFDIVKAMREHRPCMIDSEDQYLLLHKIVEQLVGHQYEQITLPRNDGEYQNVLVEDGKKGYAQHEFTSPAGDGGYVNVLPSP